MANYRRALSDAEMDEIMERERKRLRALRTQRATLPPASAALLAERAKLTDELASCERGAWPGTAAERRETAALRALAEFDRAHPEVGEAIRNQPLGPSAERVLRGED